MTNPTDLEYTPVVAALDYITIPRSMFEGMMERKNALLSHCLAALVCMQGEYQNDPLIEAVKAELEVKA